MSPKATVLFHLKETIRYRYILEETIYIVEDVERYPDGVKYSLIFYDTKTNNKVLMDNHHPKGHHVHINGVQYEYTYRNEEQLIEDFKNLIYQHMGVKL